jgi:hypothetical protein
MKRASARVPGSVPAVVHHRRVTNGRVRCMFCYAETKDAITPSAEHLLSRPVAEAFGIDRTAPVARMGADLSDIKWGVVNGIKRKCVCTGCNNGWMNRLEHSMTAVAEWLDGDPDEPLGEDRADVLRRWAMKTHMLLCFIDGNAGRFGDASFAGEAVVPPFTPARQMYKSDPEVMAGTAVGVSRSGAGTDFAWSFDYPTVKATAPGGGHARFAPASVVTLGDLQLWVVIPLLDASVAAPAGVVSCAAGLRPRDLSTLGHPRTLERMTVDFG